MTAHGPAVPRMAVLGAGHTGPVIARVATEAGYPLSIAASGDPEMIELITTVLAPKAEPRWGADAIRHADIVVLAIPLHRFETLDPALVKQRDRFRQRSIPDGFPARIVDMLAYPPAMPGSALPVDAVATLRRVQY